MAQSLRQKKIRRMAWRLTTIPLLNLWLDFFVMPAAWLEPIQSLLENGNYSQRFLISNV
jgi:hypothetical protein